MLPAAQPCPDSSHAAAPGLVERSPALGTLYYLQQTTLLFLLSPAVRGGPPRCRGRASCCWQAGGSPCALVACAAVRRRPECCAGCPPSAGIRFPSRSSGPPHPPPTPTPQPSARPLSRQFCVLLYRLLIVVARREQYRDVTAVGYSCVLFGWMTLLATKQPGGHECKLAGRGPSERALQRKSALAMH